MLWEVEKPKCANHYKWEPRKLWNDERILNLVSDLEENDGVHQIPVKSADLHTNELD